MKKIIYSLFLIAQITFAQGSRTGIMLSTTQSQNTSIRIAQNTLAPAISGDTPVGSLLSCTTGTWLYNPISYSYQWQRNGSDISSATNSYYTTVSADAGTSITCKVGAINLGGTAFANSNTITPVWSPSAFGSNLVLWLNTSNTSTMMQEQAFSGVPVTPVTSDADPIGLIYEQGNHGYFLRAEADTRRPLLGSDGSRGSYITFDGSNDIIRAVNTAKYLSPCHNSSPVFSILFWFKSGADGTAQYILNSNGGTTANAGISLQKTTANKLTLLISYASAGNNVASFTTTNTITTASGWTPVIIQINGTGAAHGSITIGNNSAETFTVNAGTSVDANSDLYIASINTLGTYLNGSLSDLLILNSIPSGTDITNFKSYNPSRSSTSFSPILQWSIDFNNSAFTFSDSGCSTTITDGGTIQCVTDNITSIFGNLNRKISSSSSGTSPLWRSSVLNGNSVAEYDGIDDDLSASVAFTAENGGKYTLFIVAKNRDSSIGSHPISGGAISVNYIPFTGSNYPGNSLFNGKNYFVTHTASTTTAQFSYPQGNVYQIAAIVRDGSSITLFNGNGDKVINATGNDQFLLATIGAASSAKGVTWNMDGFYVLFAKYIGVMSDTQVINQITTYKTRFGL